MQASRLLLFGVLGLACSRPGHPLPGRDDRAPNEPAPLAVAPPPIRTAGSEVEVDGLRVQVGTLPATGTPTPSLWGVSDLTVDLAHLRLEIVPTRSGAPLASLLPTGGLAVVNGGYFETDFRPSTWVKSGGVQLAPKADPSKGGVLALSTEGLLYLGTLAGLKFEPSFAIQSFPLIVEPDFKHGIHSDDGRRAARTVACLIDDTLHFLVITAPRGEGPTLFELADLLRQPAPAGFHCRVALNLDGGPSTGAWFSSRVATRQRPPLANVGYAIAVVPR